MLVKVTGSTATPYSYEQLRRENPQVSFPKVPTDALLAEYSIFRASEDAKPSDFHAETELVVADVDGKKAITLKWKEVDLNDVKQKAINKLSAIRRQRIDAGFDFGGMTAPCDDESQRVYTGAYVLAKDFPDMKRKWKLPSGFVELGATELQQLSLLASQHVQAQFDWQAEQVALVEAAKDVNEVDAVLKAAQA